MADPKKNTGHALPLKNDSGPLFWFNAGEASGDMHGASLIRAMQKIKPDARFIGMGGDAMRECGMHLDFHSRQLSLMGLTEVFAHLPRIGGMLRATKKKLKAQRPDAMVLLDSPDYNFLLARMGRQLGIPVFFYISPQVWAWRTGRVKFLEKHARRILCILPFEKPFYEKHNVAAEFVGHPLMDELDFDRLLALPHDPKRIGILPGSRRKEIETLMSEFAEAARQLHAADPQLRFRIIRAPGVREEQLRSLWPDNVPMDMAGPENRYEAMRSCSLLLAASGTVTFEASLIETPCIVAYKLAPVTYWLARKVVTKIDYISLTNLIMDAQVLPELLQDEATAEALADTARKWLTTPGLLEEKRETLARLRERMGPPGAPQRAAEIIFSDLGM
jgi:lipid-A-disaccharide synthase